MGERPLVTVATHRGLVGGPFGSSLVGTDYVNDGVPVIRGTNMADRYVCGEFAFVSPEKFSRDLARNNAVSGDLIFTQRGTLGQVATIPGAAYDDYVVSQSQMRLRVDENLADPMFVYYACRRPQFLRQVSDNAIATGVPHINLGILSRLTIPDLPIDEQRAIAEGLGALDDKIATNDQLLSAAEELMVSLAGAAPARTTVASLATQSKRVSSPGSFDASVAHYSLPAFDSGAMPENSKRDEIKSNKFVLDEPVVLISKLNPRIPRIWNVSRLPKAMAVASMEFVVLTPSKITSSALWAVLNQSAVSAELANKVSGTSGSHQRVKPSEVLELSAPDPRSLAASAQTKIDALGEFAHSLRLERQQLATTRDELLPLLMSGKVRMRDAEKVVEEVV